MALNKKCNLIKHVTYLKKFKNCVLHKSCNKLIINTKEATSAIQKKILTSKYFKNNVETCLVNK